MGLGTVKVVDANVRVSVCLVVCMVAGTGVGWVQKKVFYFSSIDTPARILLFYQGKKL